MEELFLKQVKKNSIVLVVGFYSLLSFAQKEKLNLAETKWQCEIEKDCINTYYFKLDHTYVFYSCEMDTTYYGTYKQEDGFLMIHETNSMDTPSTSFEQALYKMKNVDTCLIHIERSEWNAGKWIPSTFVFDEQYRYCKVESVNERARE
ncbi:hypothetical protein [Myroides sp. DW712]|uniref:hypothetical protein n=1 Tax=Myroides sp. DW712 TaxID=3389800 RepID=UPI00397A9500